MPTITDLPPEIILQIHLLAQNPLLPQAHPSLYHPLHAASTHYVATYLLALYSAYGADELLVRALRHPVCDVQVARDIRRIWDKRRGYYPPVEEDTRSRRRKGDTGTRGEVAGPSEVVGTEVPLQLEHAQEEDADAAKPPHPPEPTAPALSCSELPRRLFRPDPTRFSSPTAQSSTPGIHPLLEYLFSTYRPSPNSHKGYPLCRAVLTSNTRLISFLLSHGADPGMKDCLPVEIAVQMRDLGVIKLLVERLPADTAGSTGLGHCSGSGSGVGAETPSPRGEKGRKGKRIKLGDRVTITSKLVEAAIKSGSDDIVHYFVHEKGVMPPLRSIMKLGKPDDAQHSGPFTNKSTRRTSTPTRSHLKRSV